MTTDANPGIAYRPKIAKDGRVMSLNSLANLKPPYQKGENGHKGGYALGNALKHLLTKPYSEITGVDKTKLKVGDVIALSTVEGAILREPAPFHEVWDRNEGKVADKHQVDIRQISVIEVVIGNSNQD